MDKLKERRESLQKLRVEVLKRLESVEDDIKKQTITLISSVRNQIMAII